MGDSVIHIHAKDCLSFDQEVPATVLEKFIATQSNHIFRFSNKRNDDDKLAEYDYRGHQWIAGRYVGESTFNYKGQKYKITIQPRFGEGFLLRMLEEIYKIKITNSISSPTSTGEWNHYLKRILAFIWIQKLAIANLHGVPKVQIKKKHQGSTIRGRLNVRSSIIPYRVTSEIVSNYHDKEIDRTVVSIIKQAYSLLKSEFELGTINLPDSAQKALNQIFSSNHTNSQITYSQYKNIKYKAIYYSWKPVVDLSWDIIQQKEISLKQKSIEDGFGFFLDIAEIWEQYLRSLLKRGLLGDGWSYKNPIETAYQGYFFKRTLIPDLVFQQGNRIAIWDAKYKRMLGRSKDVDRSDFFQIHTYIQQFSNFEVLAGGLLYPLSWDSSEKIKSRCPYLLTESNPDISFSIDGIQLTEDSDNYDISQFEEEFISRTLATLKERKPRLAV